MLWLIKCHVPAELELLHDKELVSSDCGVHGDQPMYELYPSDPLLLCWYRLLCTWSYQQQ
jgi:hypothetical protein